MSIYAIGDIQGCYDSLMKLLERIKFDDANDKLWFAGDLVNRGKSSLQTLRFIKSLGKRAKVVLGNHDLTLLALAYTDTHIKKHTLDDVLKAPDREELLYWLRHQKLYIYSKKRKVSLAHAGVYPLWNISQALSHAHEVEQELRSESFIDFLNVMFGSYPVNWQDNLEGWDRLRFIINAFTRMRYCDSLGNLQFKDNGPVGTQQKHHVPWFKLPQRCNKDLPILFGHWSTLFGKSKTENVYALDTGCLWGGQLTALKLPKKGRSINANSIQLFQQKC
ncbi:MAG: symmetrical bis(5'-nucleosyl)-tetraphosphatase [Gammaproteobacteria bacterium]|nr:symmetrical bis(5'-nucleosyl)-tetraphosphatase [Gammaproteobacteria bacterium]